MARHSSDDCQAGQDNEFGIVRFFPAAASVKFSPNLMEPKPMFAFDRSALAVLVPLALLLAAAMYSNRTPDQTADTQSESKRADQTVAANLPSR
jgi:hypothetical protein